MAQIRPGKISRRAAGGGPGRAFSRMLLKSNPPTTGENLLSFACVPKLASPLVGLLVTLRDRF
jgi:hypothetical protein